MEKYPNTQNAALIESVGRTCDFITSATLNYLFIYIYQLFTEHNDVRCCSCTRKSKIVCFVSNEDDSMYNTRLYVYKILWRYIDRDWTTVYEYD